MADTIVVHMMLVKRGELTPLPSPMFALAIRFFDGDRSKVLLKVNYGIGTYHNNYRHVVQNPHTDTHTYAHTHVHAYLVTHMATQRNEEKKHKQWLPNFGTKG